MNTPLFAGLQFGDVIMGGVIFPSQNTSNDEKSEPDRKIETRDEVQKEDTYKSEDTACKSEDTACKSEDSPCKSEDKSESKSESETEGCMERTNTDDAQGNNESIESTNRTNPGTEARKDEDMKEESQKMDDENFIRASVQKKFFFKRPDIKKYQSFFDVTKDAKKSGIK